MFLKVIAHLLLFCAGPMSIYGAWYAFRQYNRKKKRQQLSELDDCPFPFTVEVGGGTWYIVVDFDNDLTLWCDYDFGIRADGIYGVNELKIQGLNSYDNSDIELKIGQSVFPLVNKVEQFVEWLEHLPFDYSWDKHLAEKWDDMKKKLDNLRYLEYKSKEKEKKHK